MDVKTHINTAKVECRWAIGLLFPKGISYVTKIENYPDKSFYWDSEDEPLYFESKRTADDYAFGMLLNGYRDFAFSCKKVQTMLNFQAIRDIDQIIEKLLFFSRKF